MVKCNIMRLIFSRRLRIICFCAQAVIWLAGCGNDAESGMGSEKLMFPIHIDYRASVVPWLMPNSDRNYLLISEYEQKLEDETRISLKMTIREWGKSSIIGKNSSRPDLVFLDGESLVHPFLSGEQAAEVNGVVNENGKYIHERFPEPFWKYRKQTGKNRAIPLHTYQVRFEYGFWIIKKSFLREQNITVGTNSDLLELLNRCGPADPGDIRNWYRNSRDVALLLSADPEYSCFDFLSSLFGLEFTDHRMLLFDHSRTVWMLPDELGIEKRRRLQNIASLSPAVFRPSYENITRVPWAVMHVPYFMSLYPVSGYQLDRLRDEFNNDEYLVVHDSEIALHLPSEKIISCFIMEDNEKNPRIVQALNGMLRSTVPQNLFLFNIEPDGNVNQVKLHEMIAVLYHPLFYHFKHNLLRSLRCFFNPKFFPRYDIFPESAAEGFDDFTGRLESGTLAGMNVYTDFRDYVIEKGYLKVVYDEKEGKEVDHWISFTPPVLGPELLSSVLSSDQEADRLLGPYNQVLQTIRTDLQERTDLFLKLYFND